MNPLLVDFPDSFSTERLFIRMPYPQDGKVVYDAIQSSLTELQPWVAFAQRRHTEADIETIIRQYHVDFLQRKELVFLLFHKQTGAFVAFASLHEIKWNVLKFNLGYWIDSRWSRNGYMTEGIEGILDFTFHTLQANRVEIHCESTNRKSCVIPPKLGFRLEGILEKNTMSVDGSGLRDTCLFAMTRQRYTHTKKQGCISTKQT
ncbi:GNAT family N-acetyltransferase [Bacillus sp. AF62]|uniref:GNAT family N-acetyltransferase n=2 Tax=Bacillus sp. AF62 TaxID=3158960 RepID=UPI003D03CE5B